MKVLWILIYVRNSGKHLNSCLCEIDNFVSFWILFCILYVGILTLVEVIQRREIIAKVKMSLVREA